jgi:uncharacterized protein DUF4255
VSTLNLSLVTLSLRSLLHANVRRLLGGIEPNELAVTLMPPELVEATVQTLNLHLYHVSEDPHYKNAMGMDLTTPPIADQPMALRLYYILTPHLTRANMFDAETQQHLLGLAMKTIHDHPLITDDLQIIARPAEGPITMMETELRGGDNRIEITLRPLEPEETVNFWAAEDQKTPRLSAFYEVRTIFMQPEKPKVIRGTVFDVGLYVESSMAARLHGSHSVLPFTMPATTGLGDQQLDVVPARATLQPVAIPNKPRVYVTGHNLTTGDAREIRIRQADGPALLLDPGLNAVWDLQIVSKELSFVPQPTLDADDGTGAVVTHDIVPGYTEVSMEVIGYRFLGSSRLESRYDAGRVTISLGAHITGFANVAGGRLRVNISNAVDLTLAGTEVTLAVRGNVYEQVGAFPPAPDDRGTFTVHSDHVIFTPDFGPPLDGAHPVQLIVNGAESQPFWVEL